MITSSLKLRGEMFDNYMANDNFEKNHKVNVCSIMRINTDIARIQDVLTYISVELSNSYIRNIHGKFRYEYKPEKSQLEIFVWGQPEFLVSIICAVKSAEKTTLV